ncbi:MAG: class I SAM-dependent methyltransferase [Chloroflexota bacterium]
MTNFVSDLYHKYFVDRQFERLDLFQQIAKKFGCQRALYPGSFVHVTPSFVFPEVVYVDSDKQAKKFFTQAETVEAFVTQQKLYPDEPQLRFYAADYRKGIDEPDESFDLMISQYAGFVGQDCKRYLKKGGILLVNNSHGDAGVAALDDDYELIATVSFRNEKHRIGETNLAAYFVPKSSKLTVTRAYLIEQGRGIGYQKSATAYLFQRR